MGSAGRGSARQFHPEGAQLLVRDDTGVIARSPILAEEVDAFMGIDQVADVAKDRRLQVLVRHMVRLCQDLGARVVAEGIEQEEEMRALVDLGAHYGQGYYLGMPTPEAEMLELAQPLEPGFEVRDVTRPILGAEGISPEPA